MSYLYTVAIGFFITFTIGYITSRLLKALNIAKTDRVYIDGDKNLINYNLFFPPIAASLKRQQAKRENLLPNNFLNGELNVSLSDLKFDFLRTFSLFFRRWNLK